MTIDTTEPRAVNGATELTPAAAPTAIQTPAPTPQAFGNSGPLCLFAFAVVTFMISMVNAGAVNKAVVPIVISIGLFFGGGAQLVGGLLQYRYGNPLNGALFSTFGAFWIAFAAFLQWFSKEIPASQAGHAQGLMLYAFAVIALVFLIVSLRTTVASVVALTTLTVTLTLLAVGNYSGNGTVLHVAGVLGIILAAMATYMGAAELAEYSYGKPFPLGQLSKR